MNAIKGKYQETLTIGRIEYHKAVLHQKNAHDKAVASIEDERRRLREQWLAESKAAALQAGMV